MIKPDDKTGQCRVCKFKNDITMPNYIDYHDKLYLRQGWKRSCLSDPEMKETIKLLKLKKKDRILEIGCGVGNYLHEIERITSNVVAIDQEISYAKKKLPNLSFLKVDCNQTLPFANDSFDKILCVHTIEHLKDPFKLLSEISRILIKDGLFIVTTIDYNFWGHKFLFDPTHLWEWDKQSFEDLLQQYFEVKKLKNIGSLFNYYPANLFFSLFVKPDLISVLVNSKKTVIPAGGEIK
jgi:ubiquinone/menaquinone biosynthesis C-methylase UbiE